VQPWPRGAPDRDRFLVPLEAMQIGHARNRGWLRVLLGVMGLWAMLGALILLEIAPHTPRTRQGWILLLIVGPPAYLALTWLGERLVSPRLGARISSARFSLARILIGVLAGSVLVALSVWWFLWFGR
jgi:hypothetical protein